MEIDTRPEAVRNFVALVIGTTANATRESLGAQRITHTPADVDCIEAALPASPVPGRR